MGAIIETKLLISSTFCICTPLYQFGFITAQLRECDLGTCNHLY